MNWGHLGSQVISFWSNRVVTITEFCMGLMHIHFVRKHRDELIETTRPTPHTTIRVDT